MVKVINPDGRVYQQRIKELARFYMIIRDCKNCGSPINDGYVCPFCNVDDTTYEFAESMKEKRNEQ